MLIKLKHSPHPPPGKPWGFDYLLCPGSGEFDLCLRGVGKIEPEVSGFKWFFLGPQVTNSYKNMSLDKMKEFKGRDVAFVSDWLTKKVFKRSLLKTAGGGGNLNNPILKSSNAWE